MKSYDDKHIFSQLVSHQFSSCWTSARDDKNNAAVPTAQSNLTLFVFNINFHCGGWGIQTDGDTFYVIFLSHEPFYATLHFYAMIFRSKAAYEPASNIWKIGQLNNKIYEPICVEKISLRSLLACCGTIIIKCSYLRIRFKTFYSQIKVGKCSFAFAGVCYLFLHFNTLLAAIFLLDFLRDNFFLVCSLKLSIIYLL